MTPRKIVSPRYRQIIKSNCKNFSAKDSLAEQYQISQLCKKLSDKEYTMLRVNNAKEIEYQMAKLKGKLKKQIQ